MTTSNRTEMQWDFVPAGPAMTEGEVLALCVRLPGGAITTIGEMSEQHFYGMCKLCMSPRSDLYQAFEALDLTDTAARWWLILELLRLRAKLPIVRERAA